MVKCSNLTGHNGSISKVKVDDNNVAISAAYDSSLLVWNLDTSECLQGLFQGHKDAVMEFEWQNSLCVSGARDGSMTMWDINTGKPLRSWQAHNGPVSKINFYSDSVDKNLIMSSGLKDGVLQIVDMRTNAPVFKDRIHGGAINLIECSLSNYLVTGSADKTVKIFDVMSGFKLMHTMNSTDAVFCGKIVHNLAICGCGDGNILAFDLDQGKCIYGYGADSMGAVNCLQVADDLSGIVTGGDSG